MNVLGIIPARGGSKGVPRKNIRLLAGKPLLEYTVVAARDSIRLKRFVVSTEDAEIKSIAHSLDCPVIDRPEELARDDTPSLPVIQQAALAAEKTFDEKYDAICLLQPTTPQRTGKHIDNAIELFESSQADTILSVCQIEKHFHPYWVFLESDEGKLSRAVPNSTLASRRQLLPKAFIRNGAIYLVRWDTLIHDNTLYGNDIRSFEMSRNESVNIDTMEDWEKAELAFDSIKKAEGKDQ